MRYNEINEGFVDIFMPFGASKRKAEKFVRGIAEIAMAGGNPYGGPSLAAQEVIYDFNKTGIKGMDGVNMLRTFAKHFPNDEITPHLQYVAKLAEKDIAEFNKMSKELGIDLDEATEFEQQIGAKKAYKMGMEDAISYRPKKNAENSFGPYASEYYKGYKEGEASNDHNDWREKTAAKRQGRHYHESAGDLECTKSDPCGYCKKCKERGTLKVSEGKWDYPDHAKGKGDDYLGNAQRKRDQRKEFRKAEKAKAHKARMQGQPVKEDDDEYDEFGETVDGTTFRRGYSDFSPYNSEAYECGWCGSATDPKGNPTGQPGREGATKVNGKCCPGGSRDFQSQQGHEDEELMASRGQLPKAQARIRKHRLR